MAGDPRRHGLTPERALAVAGVVGLLLVGGAIVVLVNETIGGDDGSPARVTAPRATATPEPTPTAEPTPEPLTAGERAARAAAAELVRSRGFKVARLGDYDPRSTLRVLIGRDTAGSELAFFFRRRDYLGNDGTEPSARLRLRGQRDRQVTLAYGVYAPDDEPCCPTGGPVSVRFGLRRGAVVPRDPVPPPEQRSPAHRPA